jgi:AcrR family transcriptional regulator
MEQTKDNRRKSRRAELLAAAGSVFGSKGYSAATVDDVALKASVSKGTMYNYFPSKEALFHELLRETYLQDTAEIDAFLAEDRPAMEKLTEFLGFWYGMSKRRVGLGRLVLEFWAVAAGEGGRGKASDAIREVFGSSQKRIAAILQEGVESGEFSLETTPEQGAQLVLASLHGLQLQVLIGLVPALDEDTFSHLTGGIVYQLTKHRDRTEL